MLDVVGALYNVHRPKEKSVGFHRCVLFLLFILYTSEVHWEKIPCTL